MEDLYYFYNNKKHLITNLIKYYKQICNLI